VSDGSPVLALLQAATDAAADLIVVGRRGSGGFPGLLLGSTSHELTAHAHLPVVVVPGPVEQPAR
jgi:nucleotide-binding universal stress UspA family protein